MDWAKAVLLEVRPLPTLAAMTAGVTGMAMGGSLADWPVYAGLVGAVLFASHMKDAYVDWHVREEDQDYPWGPFPETGELIGRRGMVAAIGGALAVFGGLLLQLRRAPVAFFAVATVGALLALSYAPKLDDTPIGSAFSYPLGVGLAVVGGSLLSAGRVVPKALVYAGPLVVVLAGAKIVEDRIDADHDAEFGKRTVPVAIGSDRANRLGLGMIGFGMLPWVLWHPWIAVATLVAIGVAAGTASAKPARALYPTVAGIFVVMAAVLAVHLV